jgi:hypothetical protein
MMQDYLLDPFLFGNKYNLVNGDNPWGKYVSSNPTNDKAVLAIYWLWIGMAYQRALNEKVMQLSVLPETGADELPESCHQRRAREKEMKEYMAALDAMSAHHCDKAFFA